MTIFRHKSETAYIYRYTNMVKLNKYITMYFNRRNYTVRKLINTFGITYVIKKNLIKNAIINYLIT